MERTSIVTRIGQLTSKILDCVIDLEARMKHNDFDCKSNVIFGKMLAYEEERQFLEHELHKLDRANQSRKEEE